jgi:hypothetical protein
MRNPQRYAAGAGLVGACAALYPLAPSLDVFIVLALLGSATAWLASGIAQLLDGAQANRHADVDELVDARRGRPR